MVEGYTIFLIFHVREYLLPKKKTIRTEYCKKTMIIAYLPILALSQIMQ